MTVKNGMLILGEKKRIAFLFQGDLIQFDRDKDRLWVVAWQTLQFTKIVLLGNVTAPNVNELTLMGKDRDELVQTMRYQVPPFVGQQLTLIHSKVYQDPYTVIDLRANSVIIQADKLSLNGIERDPDGVKKEITISRRGEWCMKRDKRITLNIEFGSWRWERHISQVIGPKIPPRG